MWQELRTELHPRGLEIVTVALDVDADEAKPFIEQAHPEHPSLIDSAHVLDELFGVVNVPNGQAPAGGVGAMRIFPPNKRETALFPEASVVIAQYIP